MVLAQHVSRLCKFTAVSCYVAVMVVATHIHPYFLCVPASTPTHPVLSHGRSSLDQCWLSKESDALTYVHLFQVVLHPAIG